MVPAGAALTELLSTLPWSPGGCGKAAVAADAGA
jgi:hypothetical protein